MRQTYSGGMNHGDFTGWRLLVPAAGFTATLILIALEQLVPWVVTLAVTIIVTLLLIPPRQWRSGIEATSTDEPAFSARSQLPAILLPAVVILGQPFFLEILPLPFPVAVGLWGLLSFVSLVWVFRNLGRSMKVDGQRRITRSLASTDPSDVTPGRLRVADEHRELITALTELGAVDGVRARMWKLAEVTGRGVDTLPAEVQVLRRAGLVSVSTLDSGDDTTRHLVDLTPVGARVAEESGLVRA